VSRGRHLSAGKILQDGRDAGWSALQYVVQSTNITEARKDGWTEASPEHTSLVKGYPSGTVKSSSSFFGNVLQKPFKYLGCAVNLIGTPGSSIQQRRSYREHI
jgi:hypothetical protein